MLYEATCKICGKKLLRRKFDLKYNSKCQHDTIPWKNERLRNIFKDMKRRCYVPKCKDYIRYGAKGIKVCDEWLKDHSVFEQWAFNNGYLENLTIDRKDSSKDYCPENCRWITIEENSRFKSTTHYITVNAITMSGRQWSAYLNRSVNYINTMIRKYGMDTIKEYIKQELDKTN